MISQKKEKKISLEKLSTPNRLLNILLDCYCDIEHGYELEYQQALIKIVKKKLKLNILSLYQIKQIQIIYHFYYKQSKYPEMEKQIQSYKPLSYTISLRQHDKQERNRKFGIHEFQQGQIQYLSKGASFWSLQSDFKPIYQNFNILSYFSPTMGVNIHDIAKLEVGNQTNLIYQFSYNNKLQQKFYILELKKDKCPEVFGMIKKLSIEYCVKRAQDYVWEDIIKNDGLKIDVMGQFSNCILVDFSTQVNVLQEIIIQVYDKDNWILNNMYKVHYDNRQYFDRISQQRKSSRSIKSEKVKKFLQDIKQLSQPQESLMTDSKQKSQQKTQNSRFKEDSKKKQYRTDIEYFYIQPLSQRKKIMKGKHLSLALQGGGCKGVTYIGAYKAIIEKYIGIQKIQDQNNNQQQLVPKMTQSVSNEHQYEAKASVIQQRQITSIIGSSAGGIIGLAVCCHLTPEMIVELCENHLSKVTDDIKFPKRTPKIIQNQTKHFKTLENILTDFNIIDQSVIELVKLYFQQNNKEQNIDKIIKSIMEKAKMLENKKIMSLFKQKDQLNPQKRQMNQNQQDILLKSGKKQENNQKKFNNLCGLLNGMLMNGQSIRTIGKQCLNILFRNKKYTQKISKVFPQKIPAAEKITMKQLYDITGIQFTCTSVDITNHVLRFFNHKTTPKLPVVNAVQMTGSFPIAFEATYWKKDWGKYYIHYDNMRRQVDLEDCKFTDGGMLANFPIDYIDNEELRPMYFSHVKDSNTIIYGIGLQACKEKQQSDQLKNKIGDMFGKDGLIKNLGWGIFGQIPSFIRSKSTIIDKISNVVSKSQVKEVELNNFIQRLRQIPMIDFIYNLLLTFASTKDKLAEQCFRHRCFDFTPSKVVLNYIKDRQQVTQQHNQIKILQKFKQQIQQIKGVSNKPYITLIQNIKDIKNYKVNIEQNLFQITNKLNTILTNLTFQNISLLYNNRAKFQQLDKYIYQTGRFQYHWTQRQKKEMRKQYNTELLIYFLDKKAQLGIYDMYEDIKHTMRTRIKKYSLDRVFYLIKHMLNPKPFVLCDVNKDYQLLIKICEKIIDIISFVFERKYDYMLKQQTKLLSQKSQNFQDLSYQNDRLAQQRKLQVKTFQKLNQKIQPKLKQIKLKIQIASTIQMLQNTIKHNSSRFKSWFSNSPYQQNKLRRLLQKLKDIPQYQQTLQLIHGALQSRQNKKYQKITQNMQYILSTLDQFVGNTNSFEDAAQFLQLKDCIMTLPIQKIRTFLQGSSQYVDCISRVTTYDNTKQKKNLISYIERSIYEKKRTLKPGQRITGMHIVMQSSPLSQLYFFNVTDILKTFHIEKGSQEKIAIVLQIFKQLNISIKQPQQQPTQEQYNQIIQFILERNDIKDKFKSLPDIHQLIREQKDQQKSQNIVKIMIKKIIRSFKSLKNNESELIIPITSITTSNIHSIAAIMYASDLPRKRMQEYTSKIKDLIYENSNDFNDRIQKRLHQGQWLKPMSVLLRQTINKLSKRSQEVNVFNRLQKQLSEISTLDQLEKVMIDIRKKTQIKDEQINTIFEQSLDFVMNQFYKYNYKQLKLSKNIQKVTEKIYEQLCKNLAINYKNNKFFNTQKNTKEMVNLVDTLYKNFTGIIKVVIESNEYIAQQFVTNVSSKQRKQAWKYLIVGQLHDYYKIKKFVQDIMVELKLSRDTTLVQFYQTSSRKITINFPVINTKDECIQIINHHTRPYMPVWAAVVASSSLIQFSKPFVDRLQWSYKIKQNYEHRSVIDYFRQQGSTYYHLYSADSLRKLPVDLLTNTKILETLYPASQNRKQVFLIFRFNMNQNFLNILNSSKAKNKKKFEIHNLNIKDLLVLKDKMNADVSLKSIPLFSTKLDQLQININSHDRLISNLYKKQMIMLPIRLDTLDFHLMCDEKNGNLSHHSSDCIMESYYVMKEKIINCNSISNFKHEEKGIAKIMYIRIQNTIKENKKIQNTQILKKQNKKNNNQQQKSQESKDLTIRFLSRQVPFKRTQQNYKIFYKLRQKDKFIQIGKQFLRINIDDKKLNEKIFIKIEYVELGYDKSKKAQTMAIKSRCFELNVKEFIQQVRLNNVFGYVYKIQYSQRKCMYIPPQKQYSNQRYNEDYVFRLFNQMQQTGKIKFKKSQKQIKLYVKFCELERQNNYESPICQQCHDLKIKSQRIKGEMTFIFRCREKCLKCPQKKCLQCSSCKKCIPSLSCQACSKCEKCPQKHIKKHEKCSQGYQLDQKYQIILTDNKQIKCIYGHNLYLRKRFQAYPVNVVLYVCDLCKRFCTLGAFNDSGCGIDICQSCLEKKVRHQRIQF